MLLSGYVGGEGGIVGDGALGARLSEIQRDKQCYMYFMPNKSRQKEKRVRENTHRYNVVAPSGGRGGGNVEEGGVCVGCVGMKKIGQKTLPLCICIYIYIHYIIMSYFFVFGVLTGLLVVVERVRHGSVVHVRARSGAVVEAGESKDLTQV